MTKKQKTTLKERFNQSLIDREKKFRKEIYPNCADGLDIEWLFEELKEDAFNIVDSLVAELRDQKEPTEVIYGYQEGVNDTIDWILVRLGVKKNKKDEG